MIRRLFLVSILAGIICVFIVQINPIIAAEPPKEPLLKIETGMHTAPIRRISVDRENRFLATASEDKTVRLWDAATGALLRIIRPPIGEGHEGKINAVALSPDGKTVAVGGYTGFDWEGSVYIYIFDTGTGRLLRRLTGLPSVINHLALSRDGRHLAACLGQNNGIRIYRTSDFTLAGEDKDYGGDSYGADFNPTDGLVTTSYDGDLRRYDERFRLIARKKAPGGSRPYGVRFSPDGQQIVVGFNDTTAVNVLNGKDLTLRFTPDTMGVISGLEFVSWSADGRRLYAGGRYVKLFGEKWNTPIRTWSEGGQGGYTDIPAANSTIMDLQPRKGGGVFFAAADPALGAIDSTGNAIYTRNSAIGDYRALLKDFQVSYDGTVVRFAYQLFGKSPAVFSLTERRLATGATVPDGLVPVAPRTEAPGLTVTDWKENTTPKINGVPLKLRAYETSFSLAIAPDDKTFLLGTHWFLRLFNSQGEEIWQTSAPGVAWAVNISSDGRFALAAFGDGTIRWYNMKGGKEVLAFFPHNDRKRWVAWSPSGYYDASPGAEELIGWHLNRGKDNAADFFPASRFRSTYYRPDVIARVMETQDEKEAVRLANEESGRKRQDQAMEKILPPVVTILSPADGSTVSTSEITLSFDIRSPSGEPVTSIRALVDGRPASTQRGVSIKAKGEATQQIRVTIPDRNVEVSIIAENRYAASEPSTIRLRWQGKVVKEEFTIKPKLYVLAIGVSIYEDRDLILGYAAKDARDFAKTLEHQKGGLYRDVMVRVLTDRQATRDDIMDGLEWIQRETTSKDIAMVFLAGHGVNDQSGIYYYLPVNAKTDRLKRTGVAFSDIKNTVASLAGKAVLFVDTCHSGNVMGTRRGGTDITAVVNELASAENGAVVFASSTGKQYSLEDKSWGNGAFTKALVEGLSGKADYHGKGKITINMLDLYLSERVKELTKGKQTPTTTKPQTISDFPVAMKR